MAPNGTNAIPARVTAWLDVRCADDDALAELVEVISASARERAERDGTAVTLTAESVSAAVAFDPVLAASLAADGRQVLLIDLGSTNGTFVNGERVERAALKEGDRLGVGRVELVVAHELAEAALHAGENLGAHLERAFEQARRMLDEVGAERARLLADEHEAAQLRDLGAARVTPRRPDVEQHDLALVVGE